MTAIRFSILFFLSVAIYSCNKTALPEKQKVVIGTWDWKYTATYDENCYSVEPYIQKNYDTIVPNTSPVSIPTALAVIKDFDYDIRIKENKRVVITEYALDSNGEIISDTKVKTTLEFYTFQHIAPGSSYYRTGNEYNFSSSFGSGIYYSDTIMLSDYPIDYWSCSIYIHNYFVRI